jgi:hypothetical protein
MELRHLTVDTPRCPHQVLSGQTVQLVIGTYPVEPGQSVTVDVKVTHANGRKESFAVEAVWRYNDCSEINSYWVATLDPFKPGDDVTYLIHGRSGGGVTSSREFSFTVEVPADEL